jgi:transposase
MRRGRPKSLLTLTDDERETLERWARRPTTAQALAQRARIVLACTSGKPDTEVAREVQLTRLTVGRWRRRFITKRVAGLLDEPRPGAPRTITDEHVERVVRLTLETAPRDATHWSTRTMARRCGLTQTAVSRIWRAFALQPHRTETFKLSKDPLFIEKVRDIVGLDLNPPDKALVLCVDEKTQIQALDRSQPVLPMRPAGRPRCSPPSIRRAGRSSARSMRASGRASFASSSRRSTRACPRGSRCTSSSTTPARTKRRPFTAGSRAIPAFTCTSRRPAHHGSISSSGGLPPSRKSSSGAASIAAHGN